MGSVFIRTYGCQMNVYDSQLASGILTSNGYTIAENEESADVILVTGCTIREHADQRALGYLQQVLARKRKRKDLIVGLMGCLGQRVGLELQDSLPALDLILGPDAYRNLPKLLQNLPNRSFVELENPLENYDDIPPLRKEGATAFLAISRGCDHDCTYCIVPFTRGRERSRSADSIVKEVEGLVAEGFKEVTLLGQNVNSYKNEDVDFPELLTMVSDVPGIMRVRFTTSHPKNISEKLVHIIAKKHNVCSHVHLPVQSGSDRVLEIMGREYTAQHYLNIIDLMKLEIPDICITTDIISGYPGESEDDHQKTLELVQHVVFDGAYTFKFSARDGTPAHLMEDTVDEMVKKRRLNELCALQRDITARKNQNYIGKEVTVMVETTSKRSPKDVLGKTDGNKNVIIPDIDLPVGTFCVAKINAASSQTLLGSFVRVLNDNEVNS